MDRAKLRLPKSVGGAEFPTASNFGDTSLGSSGVGLAPDSDLLVVSVSTTKRTLTATLRNGGGATVALGISQGGTRVFPGAVFSFVKASAADAGVGWVHGPSGIFDHVGSEDALPRNADGSLVVGGISAAIQQVLGGAGAPIAVFLDGAFIAFNEEEFFQGVIAAASAEAVSTAGVNTLPVGTLVRFQLSAFPNQLVTAADVSVWVAIKGHTSGSYYALTSAGPVSGSFRIVVAEKLDIVTRNQDTGAKLFQAHWVGSNGDFPG